VVLQVERLTTVFDLNGRETPAVRAVSFEIRTGETLALVGESGSGKSVTALSLLRLVHPPGRIAGGSILWKGLDLATLEETRLHKIRGREIALVLQDPSTALNPVFTVGDQIVETLLAHGAVARPEARARMLELLDVVRIQDPVRRAADYPHQLSGGLRQRVMIALALAGDPTLLIADEPTTGLDATTQSNIVELLRDLVGRQNLSLLLISHDLAVVGACADRVAVMYAGQIIEEGPARAVLNTPGHPYTRGLLASVPGAAPGVPLRGIEGSPPRLGELPPGCAFAPRCPDRLDTCDTIMPEPWSLGAASLIRCHLYDPAQPVPAAATDAVGPEPAI
jgi:oligopeptide/dipeptide ABC transporter ATP-binding protein